uniref:DUF3713 domain-containing protein n=1 Tax=Mycoplasmoides pneumoniae TaxID=2104 RepID=UPI001914B173
FFAYQAPKDGLDSLYDQAAIGSALQLGYAFPAFREPNNGQSQGKTTFDPTPNSAQNFGDFIKAVFPEQKNGQTQQSNTSSRTGLFDWQTKWNSNGAANKLLVTKSNLRGAFKGVGLATAIIDQYEYLVGGKKTSSLPEVKVDSNKSNQNPLDSFFMEGKDAVAIRSIVSRAKIAMTDQTPGFKVDPAFVKVKQNNQTDTFYTTQRKLSGGQTNGGSNNSNDKHHYLQDAVRLTSSQAMAAASTGAGSSSGTNVGGSSGGNSVLIPLPRSAALTHTQQQVQQTTSTLQTPVYARGDDGTYALAIDGGDYFLANNKRDFTKQADILLYRYLQAKSNNFKENGVEFSLNLLESGSLFQTWAQTGLTAKLYGALVAMMGSGQGTQVKGSVQGSSRAASVSVQTTQQNRQQSTDTQESEVVKLAKSLLKSSADLAKPFTDNPTFKKALTDIQSEYKDYLAAAGKLSEFKKDLGEVSGLQQAIIDRADKYIQLEKQAQKSAIGLGQPLPYQRASDGSYPALEKFFIPEDSAADGKVKASESGSAALVTLKTTDSQKSTNTVKQPDIKPTRENNDKKLKQLTSDVETKASSLITKWGATPQIGSQFSEIVSLKSKDNKPQTNMILALLSDVGIKWTKILNSFKEWFFTNTNDFKNNYDSEKKELKGNEYKDFNDLVKQTLYLRSWQRLTSKEKFGYYKELGSVKAQAAQSGMVSLSSSAAVANAVASSGMQKSGDQTLLELGKKAFESELEASSSDGQYKYLRFLSTLMWLVKDGAKNYKRLLQQAITVGTRAFVSWTVSYDDTATASAAAAKAQVAVLKTAQATNTQSDNPFNKFVQNPDYVQGSETNWFNDKSTPIKPDSLLESESTYNFTAEPFDDKTKSQKRSTGGTTNEKHFFGFNGLTINSPQSVSTASAGLTEQIFNNFGQLVTSSDKSGALSQYKDKATLKRLIQNTNSDAELNAFGEVLHRAVNVDTSNLGRFNSSGEPLISFDNKKKFLVDVVDKLDDVYFNKFEGYVGQTKVKMSDSSSSSQGNEDYKKAKAVPLTKDSSVKTLSYVIQITNEDVNKISASWKTDKNSALGLKKEIFMALLVEQALDAGTQELAFLDLVRANQVQNKRSHQQILVGDKRLYDALGQTLALSAKNL